MDKRNRSYDNGYVFFEGDDIDISAKNSILLKNKLDNPFSVKRTNNFDENFLDEDIENEWYDNDENNINFNSNYNNDNNYITNKKEIKKKQNIREILWQERNKEQNNWEVMKMMSSGIFKVNKMASNLDNDIEENKGILVSIKNVQPEFLIGKKINENLDKKIEIFKNEDSPMIKLAKLGSRLLIKVKENLTRNEMREKFWELSGTKLGNLLDKVEKKKNPNPVEKLDIDKNINYKDNNKYSNFMVKINNTKLNIKNQKESLPIYCVKDELINIINDNKILILIGETGSGKTTQLTQYLYEEGYCNYNGIIGCTQPRRVAAVSVAKRVSEEINIKLKNEVGYSIRFEDMTSSKTKIKYMTDGILLRESLNFPLLEKYSVIIMDEAHERSLNTDVLFGLLKKISENRRDLKIIITSATMNANKFSEFFNNAPIFRIPGRSFPVEVSYSDKVVEDYIDSCIKKIIEIHLKEEDGDILVFMTGQEDIEITCLILSDRLSKIDGLNPLNILPIYSQLPSKLQSKVFENYDQRKCIVATNIAETSLTLEGVKFVIDSGFCKLKVYNPKIGMDALQIVPISQANANQRSGRAGRTQPGKCFRIYKPINYLNDMFTNNIPEIQRTNLSNVVLLLKSLNVENILDFNFIDSPSEESILNALYQLWILGALNDKGSLTILGKKMSEFPLDPSLSKILIKSDNLGCSKECLIIVSMLSIPNIFYRPRGNEKEADNCRERLSISDSDHLSLLNIYKQWKKYKYSNEWCVKNFIIPKSMNKLKEIKYQIKDIMLKNGLKLKSCGFNYNIIKKSICSGYFINASRIKGIGEYINIRTGLNCKLHPTSALSTHGNSSDYIVYHELIMTTKEYINCVTAIDPQWLEELGPMFFEIKNKDTTQKILQPDPFQEPIKINKINKDWQSTQLNSVKRGSLGSCIIKKRNFNRK